MNYYKICEQKMKYLNYADNSIKNYLYYIDEFLRKSSVAPSRLQSSDFQSYLDSYNFTSVSQQNQVINAIRFLYKFGLNKKYDKVSFQRPKREKKLPRVIDKDFLLNKISLIQNLKHKTIISLGFSTGMRVSEVCDLKIKNIDFDRNMIFIENGKGRKDRLVPLSQNLKALIQIYIDTYKPEGYLFTGQFGGKYSTRSCNEIVKNLIGHEYHFHLLRHSCFTSLLESGIDLRSIQTIAGHSSSKTTEIYTHVSKSHLSKIQMPL